ncbi:penicillin-binding protein 1C [Gilvibacter sp.]|uniref:penicillin-binding protein 1C n=1 Tax=Gilvibacter sp. TaxID=2729997 RepID=UPI0025BC4FAF|nr:penicillin-binding protein 1C [Gilvibacter sp.]NQX78188.1 penicillin-binding protein 1C [Gilvibacter sp.]
MQLKQRTISFFKWLGLRRSLLLIAFGYWLFCLPKVLFEAPTSTVIESREGFLLGARIAADGQWRFPATDSVPYKFERCILLFEDEYFYKHPGVNPVAVTKALWNNLTTDSRRGGSTLTQQVIRLSRDNKARTYSEKLIEMVQATRLEFSYSKEEVLSMYASHAPFGGNVIGLETAAWRYYGLPAAELSWGQMATLAVLPNAPALVYPGKGHEVLLRKRNRLLKKLMERGEISATDYELSTQEPLPGKPLPLPQLAPHLLDRMVQEKPGQRIVTTLEYKLQVQLNNSMRLHHGNLASNEIHNAAVLVLGTDSREVLAYVGNSPTSAAHQVNVDIIRSRRSTGSILKPLLYASALQEGSLLPDMLVKDVPTSINGYSPTNFNKDFQGVISAREALSRSLNIPAVRLLESYGLERFYRKLKKAGFNSINRQPNHYGLSLILGGAEASLWEVTAAYAGLGATLIHFDQESSQYRTQEFHAPILQLNTSPDLGSVDFKAPIWTAGSIYNTFEALQEVNRPFGQELWDSFDGAQQIAWKTGTSYGFKDAWAVGVTPKYTVGVWAGNADGEGRPGLTGVQAAAPLLFEVFDQLPKSEFFAKPFDDMVQRTLCSKSGHIAGPHCEHTEQKWVADAKVLTLSCSYHQSIFLDTERKYQVNLDCYPSTAIKNENWFVLPPFVAHYYAKNHPEYKALPSYKPGCFPAEMPNMEFIFPKETSDIVLGQDFSQQPNEVVFKVAHRKSETTLYWYLNNTYVGTTDVFHEMALLPKAGNHLLTVVDANGNEISREIHIRNP